MPLTDSEIIDKVLNGNQEYFRLIIERYKEPVAGVIKRMLGDSPDAEDVGQETFIRLYNSLAGFRGDASLKTYIIRIAMNLSLNEIKKRNRQNKNTIHIESGVKISQDSGLTLTERSEIKEMINKAIEKLDPRQRSVFILRIVEGYSTRETAIILNIPSGTVLSRLARAIEEMRRLIKTAD